MVLALSKTSLNIVINLVTLYQKWKLDRQNIIIKSQNCIDRISRALLIVFELESIIDRTKQSIKRFYLGGKLLDASKLS